MHEAERHAVDEFAPEDVGAGDRGGEEALEDAGVTFAEKTGGRGADGEEQKLNGPAANKRGGGGVFDFGADDLLGVDAEEAGEGIGRCGRSRRSCRLSG